LSACEYFASVTRAAVLLTTDGGFCAQICPGSAGTPGSGSSTVSVLSDHPGPHTEDVLVVPPLPPTLNVVPPSPPLPAVLVVPPVPPLPAVLVVPPLLLEELVSTLPPHAIGRTVAATRRGTAPDARDQDSRRVRMEGRIRVCRREALRVVRLPPPG